MGITAALLAFAGGTGAVLCYRGWRRRSRRGKRVVEAPNSHFSSEYVRQSESRRRWRQIDLDRVHPINREELERLLAIVDSVGISALSSKDQQFLENMSDGRFLPGVPTVGSPPQPVTPARPTKADVQSSNLMVSRLAPPGSKSPREDMEHHAP